MSVNCKSSFDNTQKKDNPKIENVAFGMIKTDETRKLAAEETREYLR